MIGTKEAAKKKDVSVARIRALCDQGRIRPKPKKVGGNWVIADEFEVIEAGRTRPGKIELTKKKGRKK